VSRNVDYRLISGIKRKFDSIWRLLREYKLV